MCCALYQGFIKVQKLVLLPFQVNTGVWTGIVISKKLTVSMYHKNRECFTPGFHIETFTAGVFNVAGFAEYVSHNVW